MHNRFIRFLKRHHQEKNKKSHPHPIRRKRWTGFTLIELMVVISVLSFLASIIASTANVARMRARDTKRQADLKQLANALELYIQDNGTYPYQGDNTIRTFDSDLSSTGIVNNTQMPDGHGGWIIVPGVNLSGWTPGTCPNPTSTLSSVIINICNIKDPLGRPYVYTSDAGTSNFRLGAMFELSNNQAKPFFFNGPHRAIGWYQYP